MSEHGDVYKKPTLSQRASFTAVPALKEEAQKIEEVLLPSFYQYEIIRSIGRIINSNPSE